MKPCKSCKTKVSTLFTDGTGHLLLCQDCHHNLPSCPACQGRLLHRTRSITTVRPARGFPTAGTFHRKCVMDNGARFYICHSCQNYHDEHDGFHHHQWQGEHFCERCATNVTISQCGDCNNEINLQDYSISGQDDLCGPCHTRRTGPDSIYRYAQRGGTVIIKTGDSNYTPPTLRNDDVPAHILRRMKSYYNSTDHSILESRHNAYLARSAVGYGTDGWHVEDTFIEEPVEGKVVNALKNLIHRRDAITLPHGKRKQKCYAPLNEALAAPEHQDAIIDYPADGLSPSMRPDIRAIFADGKLPDGRNLIKVINRIIQSVDKAARKDDCHIPSYSRYRRFCQAWQHYATGQASGGKSEFRCEMGWDEKAWASFANISKTTTSCQIPRHQSGYGFWAAELAVAPHRLLRLVDDDGNKFGRSIVRYFSDTNGTTFVAPSRLYLNNYSNSKAGIWVGIAKYLHRFCQMQGPNWKVAFYNTSKHESTTNLQFIENALDLRVERLPTSDVKVATTYYHPAFHKKASGAANGWGYYQDESQHPTLRRVDSDSDIIVANDPFKQFIVRDEIQSEKLALIEVISDDAH